MNLQFHISALLALLILLSLWASPDDADRPGSMLAGSVEPLELALEQRFSPAGTGAATARNPFNDGNFEIPVLDRGAEAAGGWRILSARLEHTTVRSPAAFSDASGVNGAPGEGIVPDRVAAASIGAGTGYDLGNRYQQGLGVDQDYTIAAEWFKLAAARGHVRAQERLGWVYFMGRGAPRDLVRAHLWWEVSDSLGNRYSKNNLEMTRKMLSPGQVEIARRLARRCLDSDLAECF